MALDAAKVVTAVDTNVIVAGLLSWHVHLLACARKGGARRLLTFNHSHFERVATEGIEIVVPGPAL